MSFEIFMECYRHGQPASFDRALIHEAFGSDARIGDGEIDSIVYPEGDRAEVFGADEPIIEGLMFNHASGDRVFDGLWRLANQTRSIVYWPGEGSQCAVTNAETLQHIPAEMLEDIGPARIVRTGRELADYIARGR
jgi:hypothetical protein